MAANEKMYNAGAPMKTLVPFNLEIGSIVEKAIEKGIIEMLARLELMFVMKIAMIVNVIGPIKEMSANSLSVGFSHFLPTLPVFEAINLGHKIAEKKSLPRLNTDVSAGMINHEGKPLPLNVVDLVSPYLFMLHSENSVEIPFPSEYAFVILTKIIKNIKDITN